MSSVLGSIARGVISQWKYHPWSSVWRFVAKFPQEFQENKIRWLVENQFYVVLVCYETWKWKNCIWDRNEFVHDPCRTEEQFGPLLPLKPKTWILLRVLRVTERVLGLNQITWTHQSSTLIGNNDNLTQEFDRQAAFIVSVVYLCQEADGLVSCIFEEKTTWNCESFRERFPSIMPSPHRWVQCSKTKVPRKCRWVWPPDHPPPHCLLSTDPWERIGLTTWPEDQFHPCMTFWKKKASWKAKSGKQIKTNQRARKSWYTLSFFFFSRFVEYFLAYWSPIVFFFGGGEFLLEVKWASFCCLFLFSFHIKIATYILLKTGK